MRSTVLSLAALLIVMASPASAQLNRSFVSVGGSDANPCTAAAPCRSFGAAIAQTNFGGEILAVDSGGYGPFTITGPIRVIAAPGVYAAITTTSGNGIVINAGTTGRVSVTRLSLSNLGGSNGIEVLSAGRLYLDSVHIDGFAQGVRIASAGDYFLSDVAIRNGFLMGLNSEPATGTANVLVERCSMTSIGAGIQALQGSRLNLVDSAFSNNGWGVFGGSSNSARRTDINIEGTVLSDNDIGIESFGLFATVRVSNSLVTHNLQGLAASDSGALLSRQNNTVQGNTTSGAFSGTYGAN